MKRLRQSGPAGYVTLTNGQRVAIHDRKIAAVLRWYAEGLKDAEEFAQREMRLRVRYQCHWWFRLGWHLRLCRPNAASKPTASAIRVHSQDGPEDGPASPPGQNGVGPVPT